MTWTLSKEFRFEASHQLPSHDGKCARLHGHSWRGLVTVQGERLETEGSKQGMVMDYADIKKALAPLLSDYLDHHHLNDTLQVQNPTSEVVAKWIYDKLEQSGLNVSSVRIDETCTSRCVYCRSDEDHAKALGGSD